MKRELRDVMRKVEELERAMRQEEMRVLTLGHEIKDLTSLLERWKKKNGKPRSRR